MNSYIIATCGELSFVNVTNGVIEFVTDHHNASLFDTFNDAIKFVWAIGDEDDYVILTLADAIENWG